MNRARAALVDEYWGLLRARGIEHLVRPEVSAEEDALILASVKEQAERSAAEYGEENLLLREMARWQGRESPGRRREDRHAGTSERIEEAVREMGLGSPGPVYVGEYPHHSFNAQALAVKNGTLLLINTGLHYLLVEVALALNTRIVVVDRADDGGFTVPKTSEAVERRQREADENLANSLAAYILYADPRRGGKQQVDGTHRGVLSFLYADAAEKFAIAHEYGHFFAGHLTGRRPSGDEWLRKSHAQEFEADEIGMLLALKTQQADESVAALSFRKHIAVVGAFLFFAVDHLLNRVRDEVSEVSGDKIVADHPPSDARAAALRRTLTELEGPDVFQLVDAAIPILSEQEDHVIDSLRRLLRERRA
ncbi:hypothetical protein FHS29_003433 [Saccharothrix tamanrassetensis]|uniref:Uncharacterized protein n=1 Tax=Saccharothrix tamanrassetensis TaxID=1051531 RepID=A0A841CII9_9PSEU|nr:hypothetical protein [Saccharothrix tamanrassetensis]MBB5956840.1 hypothetical protein [Saccharothrix tamanrassetensis]